MPRSGTTLVEQIIASHPEVLGGGERKDIPEIARQLEGNTVFLDPRTLDWEEVRREANQYTEKLHGMAAGARRLTDKLPDNILLLGHIALLLPRARIVVCRRDLRDVALSCFFQNFRDFPRWSSSLSDCAARACEVERLIYHWREVLPVPMLEIEYELLVRDIEGESHRLIDFLGLEWHPSCLSFHQKERAIMTGSNWQVRQPVYSSSIGRWRNYAKHIEPLQSGLAGLTDPSDVNEETAASQSAVAIARQHYDAGRQAAAEAVLRAFLTKHSDTADALLLLGNILASRGSLKPAKLVLERAAKARPGDGAIAAELDSNTPRDGRSERSVGCCRAGVQIGTRKWRIPPFSRNALSRTEQGRSGG